MRTKLFQYFSASALALILAGCNFELPQANKGNVVSYRGPTANRNVVMMQLSPRQIADLTDWFTRHRTGWTYRIADLAPNAFVTLFRDGHVVAGVNVGATFIYANNWYRDLNPTEHREISLIVDPFGELPNQSPEPVPTAVTPPAGQESRPA